MKTYRKEIRLNAIDKRIIERLCYHCDTGNESDVLRFCLRFTFTLMDARGHGSWDWETGRLAHKLIDAYEFYRENIPETECLKHIPH